MVTQLRQFDFYYEEKRESLADVIVIAGSPNRLARLLGVSASTVYTWGQSGEVSGLGAVLVEDSEELGRYFKAVDLRPDLPEAKLAALRGTPVYREARAKQVTFEDSVSYQVDSPVGALSRRGN